MTGVQSFADTGSAMALLDKMPPSGPTLDVVVAYRGTPHARGWDVGAALARALRRLGHRVYEYGNYYKSLEPVGSGPLPQRADLLVYCECNDSDPQYAELASLNTKWKAYWDFDVATHAPRTLAFVEEMGFTHIFAANRFYQSSFLALCDRTYFLPIGFDDELVRPIPGVAKTVDVGLCGSPYPARGKLIERLREAGLNAKLITGRYAEEYVKTLNTFKIGLNQGVGGGRGLLPSRVWEHVGCGTLLLAERRDFIDSFFQDMRHVALYSGVEECISKAKWLLSHPDALLGICAKGRELALAHHTYLHRGSSIVDAVISDHAPPWEGVQGRVPADIARRTWALSMCFRLARSWKPAVGDGHSLGYRLVKCPYPVRLRRLGSKVLRFLRRSHHWIKSRLGFGERRC